MGKVLDIKQLRYIYSGLNDNLSFTITLKEMCLNSGDVKALTGVSGSGKSALLECIGLLHPDFTPEKFTLSDINIKEANEKNKVKLRSCYLGFMPQVGGLLPFLSIEENIRLQQDIAKKADSNNVFTSEYNSLLFSKMKSLGLGDNLLKRYPHELSIGQRQRAVFFKSLAHKPKLILVDEPTSSLDPKRASEIFDFMKDMARDFEVAVLVVTHDAQLVHDKNIASINYIDDESKESHSVFGVRS